MAVLLVVGSTGLPAGAQPTAGGAERALALRDNVVAIQATWGDGTVRDGFGFVTGTRGGETYIATADHVLRGDNPDQIAETVKLRLRQLPGRSYEGEVLETHAPDIDLGVLAGRLPPRVAWQHDVLAPEAAEVTFGTPVWFIGRDREWYVPWTPGVVNQVSGLRHEIVVDDLGVRVGSSGAPLVAADGIVGMVVRDAAADTASATLITAVELAFLEWGLPWELAPASASPSTLAPGLMNARTLELEKSSYVLSQDGIRLQNSSLGPFCCTGTGIVIRTKGGDPVGYAYFFTWDGQAYNVDDGSIVPDQDVLVSGVQTIADLDSEQVEMKIEFTARAPDVRSDWVQAGALEYRAVLLDFDLDRHNGDPFFKMGSLDVRLDVRLAE